MGIGIYLLTFALVLSGIYIVVAKKNVVKIIIGICILDYGLNLLLVLIGYRSGGHPPILSPGEDTARFSATSVDPLPQAMILTSIVIGLSVTALAVAMAVRLFEKYGTFDTNLIRKLKG